MAVRREKKIEDPYGLSKQLTKVKCVPVPYNFLIGMSHLQVTYDLTGHVFAWVRNVKKRKTLSRVRQVITYTSLFFLFSSPSLSISVPVIWGRIVSRKRWEGKEKGFLVENVLKDLIGFLNRNVGEILMAVIYFWLEFNSYMKLRFPPGIFMTYKIKTLHLMKFSFINKTVHCRPITSALKLSTSWCILILK